MANTKDGDERVRDVDIIVIGAGMVGAAIAFGLACLGRRTLVLDGQDLDYRAARANFGLVWVQGKGAGMPAYQRLTRKSSDGWARFHRELSEVAAMPIDYQRDGGLAFCLGERSLEERRRALCRLHNQLHEDDQDCEMLERRALQALLPGVPLGAEVAGASYCWRDGQVNPLQLLQALHRGIERLGGHVLAGHEVTQIDQGQKGFAVLAKGARFHGEKVVIAAGVNSARLACQIELNLPLRPQRGQILVTERTIPWLPLPASGLRQTVEGTVMIGATKEEVGLDTGTTTAKAALLAQGALQIVPRLASLKLVRQWSGLRIMTPDSYPIYAQSVSHPGAFVAACHSGVTLAASHADGLARAIDAGALPQSLEPFHHRRFSDHVYQAH